MSNNLNNFGAQGITYAFWALWDSVSANYIAGTDGTLAAGEDSGMGRLLGITDLSAPAPEAVSIPRPGDNANLGSFISNPTDGPSGTDAFASFDQVFDTAATDRVIETEGPHDISYASNKCNIYKPLFLVTNSPAQSDEAATKGEWGWQVEEYLYVYAQSLSVSAKTINAAHSYTHRLVFNERGVKAWGEAFTEVANGVTQAWKSDPYWSPLPVYYHTYVGDGQAAQTFTLDQIPATADADHLQIWEAGAGLIYTTNYAVDAAGLVTFVGTDPANDAFAVCKVMFNPGC